MHRVASQGFPCRVSQPTGTMFMTGLRTRHHAGRPQCLWQACELGTSRLRRCVQDAHNVSDRPKSWHQQRCDACVSPGREALWQISDRVYPRCAILQHGMRFNVFSKVYCDRSVFLCGERFVTGSVLNPQRHPPYPFERRAPPPPPPPGSEDNLEHLIMMISL